VVFEGGRLGGSIIGIKGEASSFELCAESDRALGRAVPEHGKSEVALVISETSALLAGVQRICLYELAGFNSKDEALGF